MARGFGNNYGYYGSSYGRKRRKRKSHWSYLNSYSIKSYSSLYEDKPKDSSKYRTKEQRERTEEEWEKWLIGRLKGSGWKFRQDLQGETKRTSEDAIEQNFFKTFKRFLAKNNLSKSFIFDEDLKSKLLERLKTFKFWDVNKGITIWVEKDKSIEIPLINRENINQNIFEVVQQVREFHKDSFQHIYDLVLLINGLPLVCIELKSAKRGYQEGFQQLKDYEHDRYRVETKSIFNSFRLFMCCNFQRVYYFWRKDLLDFVVTNRGSRQEFAIKYCHKKELEKLSTIKEIFSPENIVRLVCYVRNLFPKTERVYDATYSRTVKKDSVVLQPQDLFFSKETNFSTAEQQQEKYQEQEPEHIEEIEIQKTNISDIYVDYRLGKKMEKIFNFYRWWRWAIFGFILFVIFVCLIARR